MELDRRRLLTSTLAAGAATACTFPACLSASLDETLAKIDDAAKQPVLRRKSFRDPINLEAVELLHHAGNFICRVRSTDGAVGHSSVSHNDKKGGPQSHRGQARAAVFDANYKIQGLALWIPLATVEYAFITRRAYYAPQICGVR